MINGEQFGDLKGVTREEILDNVLSSFIVEIKGVFFMVYFIVLELMDCSWIIFVVNG